MIIQNFNFEPSKTQNLPAVIRAAFPMWFHIVPYVFLLFGLADLLFPGTFGPIISYNQVFTRFIVGYIFFNTSHLLFTIVMFFRVPEFRRIHNLKPEGWQFDIKTTSLIVIVFMFVVGLLTGGFTVEFALSLGFLKFGIMLRMFLNNNHSFAQVYGLSSMITNREPGNQNNWRIQNTEKKLFNLFIAIQGVVVFAVFLFQASLGGIFRSVGFAINFFLALLIIANAFKYSNLIRTEKFLFLGRIFIWALAPYGLIFIFISQALHGVEYTYITSRIVRNTEVSKRMNVLYWILGTTALFGIVHSSRIFVQANLIEPSPLLVIAISISIAIELTHVWMDGVIFKMKDPRIRNEISQLIS